METIIPVTHDLGEFKVRRTLPAKTRRMVGPFIFVDQFGPCPRPGHGVPECFGSCEGSQTCIEVSGACQCGYAFEE